MRRALLPPASIDFFTSLIVDEYRKAMSPDAPGAECAGSGGVSAANVTA
jgi:hypothetical protein